MSSVIRVLNEQTINQIAAGEVIENPASVVKELVENSIDAGSNEICVEISAGGRQLIRITDNGCGMSQDDAVLCLERHATSKIRELDDLNTIATMGFRGEAVPSIASISKFTLLTCQDGQSEGTMVIVDGGRLVKCSPAARSVGTTIEVKSLFFNVPVRKKFQRSPTYDTNEILKIVSIQALAHPTIKFQLISNQKTLLSTHLPKGETFQSHLGDCISDVLGDDFFSALCPLDEKQGSLQLQGFIGVPNYNRHNRTGQYLFINGRAVSSPLISFTVKEAYGTTLSTTRYPVFVLHLTLPGGLIDVNVHPQKREVRLRQAQALKDLIVKGVSQALQGGGVTVPEEVPSFVSFPSNPPEAPFRVMPTFLNKQEMAYPPIDLPPPPKSTHQEIPPEIVTTSSAKVLGTIKGYILADASTIDSNKGGLCLIDQRAAHARVVFERLQLQAAKNKNIEAQSLLIPHTVETTPHEAATLRQHLEALNQFGLNIQEFGNDTFIIHAIPEIFGNANIENLVSELMETMHNFQDATSFQKEKEKQIALAASRASVSARQKLSPEEAQSLLNQLMRCQMPFQCPQGKPTLIYLSYEDLAKEFKNA